MHAKIKMIEDQMPVTTTLKAKINEVKSEILSTCGLATTADLTTVEIKKPDINALVIKADYSAKVSVIEIKLPLLIMINLGIIYLIQR